MAGNWIFSSRFGLPWILGVFVGQACLLTATTLGHDLTRRVSVRSNGDQANGRSSEASISGDGRYVAFTSEASNLVPGDTNLNTDVFVHDRQTGETTRVSVDWNGVQADSWSDSPSISSDGQFVAFDSIASNLVPDDTNGEPDIFVHDRITGVTERVSISSSAVEANSWSLSPAISADGTCVAFHSNATNLVISDANNADDVFVRDRVKNVTIRASVDSSGVQGDSSSVAASISGDGRYVAFYSGATNLIAGDTNNVWDTFVHDRTTKVTVRVSVDSLGAQANGDCGYPSISADGRFVGFESDATNLVPGDTNGATDVFVHDMQTGQTTRVSVDSSGGQGDDRNISASLSADGQLVAFTGGATNLVPGDTNDSGDIFVHDRLTGQTRRVSVDSSGGQGDDSSIDASISLDGRYVAFQSEATNLVSGDTNHDRDVFVHGPEFILQAAPPSVVPGQALTLTTFRGSPGVGASLWAVQVDSTPLFALVLVGGFLADGTFVVSGTVPSGLGAIDVTFRAYCFGVSTFVEPSNDVTVSFLTG